MATYHIGADVDSRITELTVLGGRTPRHFTVPTTIPPLLEVLRSLPHRKVLVVEEGPMADWLYRNLRPVVDEMVICDPRRNKLICQDGDKTNRIDSRKLAELSGAGMLRAVYHSEAQDRVILKQWVSLYYDRVRQAVREVNKLRARCRMWGMRPPRGVLHRPKVRDPWLKTLEAGLAGQLRLLFSSLDLLRTQVESCRRELARQSQGYDIVARWQKVEGIGLIRAVTLLAYLDTPQRFPTRQKVWKYCGVGLQRFASGTDKWGREKPGTLRLAWSVNTRLKDAVVGGTLSAIHQGDNGIARGYQERMARGMTESHARHTASRNLLDRLMAMWKTGRAYQPDLA
jgi:transposase